MWNMTFEMRAGYAVVVVAQCQFAVTKAFSKAWLAMCACLKNSASAVCSGPPAASLRFGNMGGGAQHDAVFCYKFVFCLGCNIALDPSLGFPICGLWGGL